MTRRVLIWIASSLLLAALPAGPAAEASLASIGYSVLRWLDRADIVHHDITARVNPAGWSAEFVDDVTFQAKGSRSLHILLGKDVRLDRVSDPAGASRVEFRRQISIAALPFDVYRLDLSPPPKGESFTLRFEWTINASTVKFLNPFFRSQYFYAGFASVWHPYMPEESFFTANITVLVPPGYQAFAEGAPAVLPSAAERGDGSGWVSYSFATDVPVNGMGLLVGRFQAEAIVASGEYRVEVWRPLASASTAARVGLSSARAAEFLAERLGPPPVTQFRVIEAPFSEAASYTTLTNLVYGGDLGEAGLAGREGLALFAAHETAHKWIGAATGTRLVGAAWLSEGLAEYLGYLALAGFEGADAARRLFDERTYLPFAAGGAATARALGAIELFDNDVQWMYAKAPLLFRMLHRRLGTDRFFALTRSFLEAHRGRHVTGRDFEAWIIENAKGEPPSGEGSPSGEWDEPLFAGGAGGDLAAFFDTWVRSRRQLDYALSVEVAEVSPGSEYAVTVAVRSVGQIQEPGAVDVALIFPGGAAERVVLAPGERRTLQFSTPPEGALLDPDRWLADSNPANNAWRRSE